MSSVAFKPGWNEPPKYENLFSDKEEKEYSELKDEFKRLQKQAMERLRKDKDHPEVKKSINSNFPKDKRERLKTLKAKSAALKKEEEDWEIELNKRIAERQQAVQQQNQTTKSAAKGDKDAKKKVKRRVEEIVTEEMIEPQNTWWKHVDTDSIQKQAIKWNSLEHHGILFPMEYKPHNVPLLYGPPGTTGKKQIRLPQEVEEMATYWCQNIGLESETKDLFISNFFQEFKEKIRESENKELISTITDFKYCDWTLIHKHLQDEKERKKNMSKEWKEAEKQARDTQEEFYRFCLMDGYRERVGNIKVEPPGLFKGRGEHPKQGRLKDRILPESCVMNVDNSLPPPICTVPGRAWGAIVHDDSVNWLGYYKQETGDGESVKYVQMDKTSELKCKPDLMKYERARRLCDKVKEIRKDYQFKLLSGTDIFKKQIGTAAYFIDRLALRVGGEKNTEEEADTVGCTSLRCEHVKLDFESFKTSKPKITLDFLGKDSIRYLNEVPVPPSVFKNLAYFMKNKNPKDQLFDRVSPSVMNEYLREFMEDLTAKVFRTYNASYTLEQQLKLYDQENATDEEKTQDYLVEFYNTANKKVAILCNHQKAVSKGHNEAVEKLRGKSDDLAKKMEILRSYRKELRKNNSTNNMNSLEEEAKEINIKLPRTPDQTDKAIAAMAERIRKHARELATKDSNKNVSLTTSKINYMDPRITISFCKRTGLDVSKVFSKTIQQKFPWAMDVEPEYSFVKGVDPNARVPSPTQSNGGLGDMMKRPGSNTGNGESSPKRQKV